jgi:hypothetical protein
LAAPFHVEAKGNRAEDRPPELASAPAKAKREGSPPVIAGGVTLFKSQSP